MMVGELDYTGILVENIVNNYTVPGTDIPYVPLPALTFCLFFVFVVMVSVVLVNLLVCNSLKPTAKPGSGYCTKFHTRRLRSEVHPHPLIILYTIFPVRKGIPCVCVKLK